MFNWLTFIPINSPIGIQLTVKDFAINNQLTIKNHPDYVYIVN